MESSTDTFDAPTLVASLPFGTGEREGALFLLSDGTVRMELCDALRQSVTDSLSDISLRTLFYGSSVTILGGATGALLHYNRRQRNSWPVFAISAAAGALCGAMRWQIQRTQSQLFLPLDVRGIRAFRDTQTGEFVFAPLPGKNLATPALRISADEFDPDAADEFLSALRSLSALSPK